MYQTYGWNSIKGYWGGLGDVNLAYALPDDESGTPPTARVNRNLNRPTNGQ